MGVEIVTGNARGSKREIGIGYSGERAIAVRNSDARATGGMPSGEQATAVITCAERAIRATLELTHTYWDTFGDVPLLTRSSAVRGICGEKV